MTTADLIMKLQHLMAAHGDRPVVVYDETDAIDLPLGEPQFSEETPEREGRIVIVVRPE